MGPMIGASSSFRELMYVRKKTVSVSVFTILIGRKSLALILSVGVCIIAEH